MGILKEMASYSEAITGGKIPACVKHQWACLRFLRDLERRGKWQWDFDEAKAEAYIRWMHLFKHSKGELAGKPKEPCDYEIFVYGNIYGWRDARTGARRFRRTYEQLARKQAKSQDKAIQALYEMSLYGEPMAEVYIAATKKEQARFVWDEAEWLIRNCGLKDYFTCKYDKGLMQPIIRHLKSGSTFSRLSKDDSKKGDGSNPHFAILDEYHLHETPEYYDMMTSGMKTRKNPLLSIITTAGFELNNPCYRVEYQYVSKILNPDIPIEDDRYFAIICELDRNETPEIITTSDGRQIEPGGIIDELGSEIAIRKSNPVTGWSATVRENILVETKEAQQKPDKMRDVLTKTYNVWVNNRPVGYMDMGRWAACREADEDKIRALIAMEAGGRCYIGIDLSAKIDLTSVGFIFPYDNGGKHYALFSHSFIPEDKFLESKDNVPYEAWRDAGHITVTDGAVVDYKAVVAWMIDTCKENGWVPVEFCIDPWSAASVATDLINEGMTVVEVRQGLKTLGEPTKAFREAVYARRVVYAENPVLSWAVGNAVTRGDHNGNIMLDKQKAIQRIDPIAAIITAFTRASVAVPETAYYEPSADMMFV